METTRSRGDGSKKSQPPADPALLFRGQRSPANRRRHRLRREKFTRPQPPEGLGRRAFFQATWDRFA